MIERKLKIRINSKLKSDSKQFAMILQNETKDPHAHDAWKKVKTDSGDLMLSTSDELIFSSVISRLGSLANYETEQ